MDIFTDTFQRLTEASQKHSSILVAYSGGKESLCVLDLCCRAFRNVIAVHFYMVPGLAVIEDQMQYARDRWGVKILMYPSNSLTAALKYGTYCAYGNAFEDLPDINRLDSFRIVAQELGIPIFATGAREKDGLSRRRAMRQKETRATIIYPLAKWGIFDVRAYLSLHGIPLPDSDGRATSGVDLSPECILWLHDKHPEDYERMQAVFPFIPAIVKRRQWFGIGSRVEKRRLAQGQPTVATL